MPELPTLWTLEVVGGQTRTLGLWGAQESRLSEGSDMFTMDCSLTPFDAPEVFAYDAQIILRDPDGIIRFQGRRKQSTGSISSRSDRKEYSFAGVWKELEEIIYHRVWKMNTISGSTVTPYDDFTPEVYLNYNPVTNLLVNVGDQIRAVIDYAVTRGVNVQAGSITIPVQPLYTVATDTRCADIIRNQLVWAPDATTHIDYTTTPPTFNVYRRSALTPVVLNVADMNNAARTLEGNGPFWTASQFTLLESEALSCVDLRYRFNNTVDGQTYITRDRDVYPANLDGRLPRALSKTVDLQGRQETRVKARLVVEALPATDLGILRSFFPEQARGIDSGVLTVSQLTITRTPQDAALVGLPNRITRGSAAPWMDFDYTKEVFRISRKGTRTEDGKQVEAQVQVDHKEIITTDAPVGDNVLWATNTITESEPRPTGLAQYLYEAMRTADWQGNVVLTGTRCSFLVSQRSSLNLHGTNDPRHDSMNAPVQDVVHTIRSGAHTTEIICAPKQILGLDRMLELLRAWRTPRRIVNAALINNGTPGSNGNADVELADPPVLENTIGGTKTREQFSVNSGSNRIDSDATSPLHKVSTGAVNSTTTPGREVHTSGSKIVDVNTADVTGTAKFRATQICVQISGVQTSYTVKVMREAYPGEA